MAENAIYKRKWDLKISKDLRRCNKIKSNKCTYLTSHTLRQIMLVRSVKKMKRIRPYFLLILTVLFWAGCQSEEYKLKTANNHYTKGEYKKAFNILIPLANKGNGEAHFLLGIMYLKGLGTQKDLKKGFTMMVSGAQIGYYKAQLFVGISYLKKGNNEKAQEWFNKALSSGKISVARIAAINKYCSDLSLSKDELKEKLTAEINKVKAIEKYRNNNK